MCFGMDGVGYSIHMLTNLKELSLTQVNNVLLMSSKLRHNGEFDNILLYVFRVFWWRMSRIRKRKR